MRFALPPAIIDRADAPRPVHPQLQQCLTLAILFVLGKLSAHIHVGWMQAIGMVLWAGLIEHGGYRIRFRTHAFVAYSACSTAIGVMLMLAAPPWIYLAVIALALLQKHAVRVDGTHFFNPSNFALIAGMVFFYYQAHPIRGQLGSDLWIMAVLAVLAIWILVRVDRWVIPIVFSISYLGLEYAWVVGFDPTMVFEDVYRRFYAVSFVVFVLFMLTDPRTTPVARWAQICFGILVAVVGAGLDHGYGFRVQHLFMALFVLSPWVPLLHAGIGARRKVFFASVALFLLAIGAIIFIESQPPYYYEMTGT